MSDRKILKFSHCVFQQWKKSKLHFCSSKLVKILPDFFCKGINIFLWYCPGKPWSHKFGGALNSFTFRYICSLHFDRFVKLRRFRTFFAIIPGPLLLGFATFFLLGGLWACFGVFLCSLKNTWKRIELWKSHKHLRFYVNREIKVRDSQH